MHKRTRSTFEGLDCMHSSTVLLAKVNIEYHIPVARVATVRPPVIHGRIRMTYPYDQIDAQKV